MPPALQKTTSRDKAAVETNKFLIAVLYCRISFYFSLSRHIDLTEEFSNFMLEQKRGQRPDAELFWVLDFFDMLETTGDSSEEFLRKTKFHTIRLYATQLLKMEMSLITLPFSTHRIFKQFVR